MKKFNSWIGNLLSGWLSTMACFYIIAIVILSTLFFQRPKELQGWLLFWVTVFFQGVALPLLAFVSKKTGDKQEQILRETHDATMKVLHDVHKVLKELRDLEIEKSNCEKVQETTKNESAKPPRS